MSKLKLFNEYWRSEMNKINKLFTLDEYEEIRLKCNNIN